MGGSSPSNQTVTNRTEIDPVTQAWRSNIVGAGNALYNQGTPAYYPGSTVVPFSNQTQAGLDTLQNYAQQGAPNLQNANAAASRALSGYNPALPYAQNAAGGGLSNNGSGAQALQGFAAGGASNPYLDSLFSQGAQKVTDAVNGNFMQAGRFGANAAQTGALTNGLGNLYSQIYAPAYENQQNRALQGATSLAGVQDANMSRQLDATNMLGSLYSQGNEDAARATALLPTTYGYGMQPGQSMLDLGSMYENQANNELQGDITRYNYPNAAQWQMLQNYSGLMSGLPDMSGSTQNSTGTAQNNRVMSGLGGALGGAKVGSYFGPWGTAIGAIAGGLFGGYG